MKDMDMHSRFVVVCICFTPCLPVYLIMFYRLGNLCEHMRKCVVLLFCFSFLFFESSNLRDKCVFTKV